MTDLQCLLLTGDKQVVKVVNSALFQEGVTAQVCSNADQALEALHNRHFDGVLIDCDDCPGAKELIQTIRSAPSTCQSVIMVFVNGNTNLDCALHPEEVCPLEELGRSEFYNDYLRPNGIAHAMWGVMENSPARIINIGLYRDLRRQTFRSKDLELLRFLAPHMDLAFRLHLQLSELKMRADNLQHAIDSLATGVILLGTQAHIIHMNQTAAKILAENDGLLVVRECLHAECSAEATQLENLISQARATSTGRGLGPAGAITISRRVRPALQVLITPVRKINVDAASPVHAIAFVTDPSQRVRPAAEILHALFGLTAAECRVAFLLGDGHAPPAIADLIGVSKNTLKTQLRSIYRKTGTSRQAQLVRTLSQLAMAPVDRQTMNGH